MYSLYDNEQFSTIGSTNINQTLLETTTTVYVYRFECFCSIKIEQHCRRSTSTETRFNSDIFQPEIVLISCNVILL